MLMVMIAWLDPFVYSELYPCNTHRHTLTCNPLCARHQGVTQGSNCSETTPLKVTTLLKSYSARDHKGSLGYNALRHSNVSTFKVDQVH